jgi:hypothetical protein
MSDYEKILIGTSIPLMEVDDEEADLDYNLISNAEIDADFILIVDNIGGPEFKEIYLNLYNEIRSLEIENQRTLCHKLVDKIAEIYEFEFTPFLTFDLIEDINNFLEFVEFMEYDYIDYIASIISGLDLSILKKDTDLFLEVNWDRINSSIDSLTKNVYLFLI